MKKSFTIIELLIVVIVLAIITSMAVPHFAKARQRTLNNEAISYVKLVYDAQKMYYLATQTYLACADTDTCRSRFDVDLVSNGAWDYSVDYDPAASPDNFSVKATNNVDGRIWQMNQSGNDPICNDFGHAADFCFNG